MGPRYAPEPDSDLGTVGGTRMLLGNVLGAPVDATLFGLGTLLLFLILRFVTRSDVAAAALIVAILTLSQVGEVGDTLWLAVPYALVVFASYVALLLRFGVLAAIVGIYTGGLLLHPNARELDGLGDVAPAAAGGRSRALLVPDGARQPFQPAEPDRSGPDELGLALRPVPGRRPGRRIDTSRGILGAPKPHGCPG